MKRHPALASLSRDHHQALAVALGLRRAGPETAAEARTAFLAYWEAHGRAHFRREEELLLPAYAVHGGTHQPLVARTLGEHAVLRQRASAVADDAGSSPEALRELGTLLADHVRGEERELFPLIERTLPPEELAAVARALDRGDDPTA